MHRIILALAAGALFCGACSSKSSSSNKLKSDTDSLAYILGMNVGENLFEMDSTLNVSAVCDGIKDAFAKKTKLTTADAKIYFLRYMNVTLPENALAAESKFLKEFADKNHYRQTPSGVTYKVEELGDQLQLPVSDRDSIAIRYILRTPDDREIFSSYEQRDTLRTTLGSLNKGMKESVKMIGKGGKIKAWLPSSTAYGPDGDKRLGIEPNTRLYSEIELVDLDKYTNWSRRSNLRR